MHPVQPAVFPGFVPSGRRRCPRLQLRGSAGFTPASLFSPSGENARSERLEKSKTASNESKWIWKKRSTYLPCAGLVMQNVNFPGANLNSIHAKKGCVFVWLTFASVR
jgi:hypothetical protein